MKKLIETGIEWVKDKLFKKGAELVAKKAIDSIVKETEKTQQQIEEKVSETVKAVEEKVNEETDAIKAKVTSVVTDFGKNHGGLVDAVGSITKKVSKEESKAPLETKPSSTDNRVTKSTKALFDVKLFDTFCDVTYDKQLAVIHHVTKNENGYSVKIDSIEERPRSAKKHREERNLVNQPEHELAQAIKLHYELSGIVCKEIFHLHVPKTFIQTSK